MKLDSIVAATDFSHDAHNAAERAARICAVTGARGTLLHVVELPWLDALKRLVKLPSELDDSILEEAKHRLDALAGEIQGRTGVRLETSVHGGHVLDAVLEAAAGNSLLALGARGTHPLRDFAVGTTAERLIRKTDQPTLVVRRNAEHPYRRIVVAMDFSPHSRRAVKCALDLAGEADVHLVHIFNAPLAEQMHFAGVSEEVLEEFRNKARLEAEAAMRDLIAEAGINGRVQTCIERGDHAPSQLLAKARELKADLVVVGKHGKSLAERLLLGSVTLHLLAESPADVLIAQ